MNQGFGRNGEEFERTLKSCDKKQNKSLKISTICRNNFFDFYLLII